MTPAPPAPPPGAILLDIEGTTTPIAFVHDVLFPYARRRLAAWLDAHWRDAEAFGLVETLAVERAAEPGRDAPPWDAAGPAAARRSVEDYLAWLMDRDRKSPALKTLQGLIWEEGYRAGELRGRVFPDVPGALRRWRAAGVTVAIYSSGSELAQRRLFQSTEAGDLTAFIAGFFDTRVGPKMSPASYARIAAALDREAGSILFVSDVTAELAAAAGAGFRCRLSLRPGNPPQADAGAWEPLRSFDEIEVPAEPEHP